MTVLLAFGQGMVVALAAWAAVNDIRFRRIPNWTSAGIALLALTLAAAGAGDMATALAIGAGAFVASLVIHLIGMVGAGDVKLFAALSIWVGAERYLAFMISLAIATLLLSAYSLATRRGALRALQLRAGHVPSSS